MKKIVQIILLFNLSTAGFGQQIINGTVLNRTTQQPVPYANIGILHSNVGTLSNPDGSFSIRIPQKLLAGTIRFSALGFGKKAVPVRFFQGEKPVTIFLSERTKTLNTITITGKKERNQTFELGNRSFRGSVLETDTTYAGRSIALLIKPNESDWKKGFTFPVFLEKVNLRIFRNNLKSFRFRIRLNNVDPLTGQPGEDLLQQSIVMESTMKNGWLAFDLSALNYPVSKPFFVTFEQIVDLQDRTDIADGYRKYIQEHPERLKIDTVEFEGKKEVRQLLRGGIDLPGTFIGIVNSSAAADQFTSYVQETSFGEWKKVRGIVAATVTVSNQLNPTAPPVSEKPCQGNQPECVAEQLCRDFMDDTGLNGMQISVSVANKPIWSAALGFADVKNQIAVTDSTLFRINSVSKSLTSLALIQLVSEGKLDLDAPIQTYVPAFPVKKYPVTTRQLAGHLAGFRDYNEMDWNDFVRTEHFENAIQALRVFENDTLLFKPGSTFGYSTFGWNLIGAVIESVSGNNYLDYMAKNVWKPLGLHHTSGDDIRHAKTNRSKFYDATGQENELGDWSYKYAGGGLLSTTQDLVKLGNALLYGNTIPPKYRDILFTSQRTTDGQETGYGLGWYVGKDKNGHRIWYHAGDSFSSSSYLLIYPDDQLVIAFLANSQDGVAFDLQKIGELFYKK
ncbi:serine hydrolase [Larkinella terrae]|uniref:Serine hydrolase n=1 Tax=Larkinella terrae TaxID=2025311 RepID=A0A7K0EP88_9BACT|nr:serine hydrolase [Larkinella terrae]MRS63604.1 serine hydrolase [Larkinella terrae]